MTELTDWITKKAREFQKNIYFCFTDYAKAFGYYFCSRISSISPSTPFSKSLNTDHAESARGQWDGKGKAVTCKRSRKGKRGSPTLLGLV